MEEADPKIIEVGFFIFLPPAIYPDRRPMAAKPIFSQKKLGFAD